MEKLKKNPILSSIVCLALIYFVVNPVLFAQEDLEKKYAPILGDYEFDATEMGMGVLTVKVYIEDGALWIWPETTGEPGKLEPVEGTEFEFVIEDPDEGPWEIKFLKDEAGKYTKCHAVNEMMGFDLTGTKIVVDKN